MINLEDQGKHLPSNKKKTNKISFYFMKLNKTAKRLGMEPIHPNKYKNGLSKPY